MCCTLRVGAILYDSSNISLTINTVACVLYTLDHISRMQNIMGIQVNTIPATSDPSPLQGWKQLSRSTYWKIAAHCKQQQKKEHGIIVFSAGAAPWEAVRRPWGDRHQPIKTKVSRAATPPPSSLTPRPKRAAVPLILQPHVHSPLSTSLPRSAKEFLSSSSTHLP